MGSAPSRRTKAPVKKISMEQGLANVDSKQGQAPKMPRVRSFAAMPKPCCDECGAADRTAQYRSSEQRRLCSACWLAYGSLPDISQKTWQSNPSAQIRASTGECSRSTSRFSPLPLMVNTTRRPSSSMGPIAQALLRGNGIVALDPSSIPMRRRSLSEACLKEHFSPDDDDCSTQAPSDVSSDSRSSMSETGSDVQSRSSSSSSDRRGSGSMGTWNGQKSAARRKTLPCISGHVGVQQTSRTARRDESRRMCERRPKSNMLRRRYVHSCA